jgi:hypothetical protein
MATVTVGCKLPHGLVLELIEPPANTQQLQPMPRGKTVTLAGANSLRIVNTNPAIGKFALTQVDKAFWEEWFKRNKAHPAVVSGAIFMHESATQAAAIADENKDLKTGLEPLNPAGDPRTEKNVQPDKDQLRRLGVAA